MTEFSSDFEPVWSGTDSTSTDTATIETTDETSAATDPADGPDAGPLQSHIEVSGWTQDEIMLALQAANVALFVVAVYLAWEGSA